VHLHRACVSVQRSSLVGCRSARQRKKLAQELGLDTLRMQPSAAAESDEDVEEEEEEQQQQARAPVSAFQVCVAFRFVALRVLWMIDGANDCIGCVPLCWNAIIMHGAGLRRLF